MYTEFGVSKDDLYSEKKATSSDRYDDINRSLNFKMIFELGLRFISDSLIRPVLKIPHPYK